MHFLSHGLQELLEKVEQESSRRGARGKTSDIQMDAHRMKGTIFLGELWSNRDSNRFLKENKIYMTKVKLIDRMQALKKTFKETEKDESLNEINIDSCRSLDEPKNHPRTTFPTHHLTEKRKNGLAENLELIQAGLKDLKKNSGARSLVNEVKYL